MGYAIAHQSRELRACRHKHRGNQAAFTFLHDTLQNKFADVNKTFRGFTVDIAAIHHRLSALENDPKVNSAPGSSADANFPGLGDARNKKAQVSPVEHFDAFKASKQMDLMHGRLDELERVLGPLEESGQRCEKKINNAHKTLEKHGNKIKNLETKAASDNDAATEISAQKHAAEASEKKHAAEINAQKKKHRQGVQQGRCPQGGGQSSEGHTRQDR